MVAYQQRFPDAPPSHLVVCIKAAISRYSRRGCSIDTRRYAPERRRHYPVTSLDTPLYDGQQDGHDVFTTSQYPTEMLAIAHVLFEHLVSLLSREESLALQLLLSGFDWPEIGELLYPNRRLNINDRGETMTEALERGIQKKAGLIWETAERDKRPPQKRRPNSPHYQIEEIPKHLVPHLTQQEKEALELYIAGHPQTEVARATDLSQSTVSRLLSFVREAETLPPETLSPRKNRIVRTDRRKAFFALFADRESGATIPRQEMLAFFADAKNPAASLCVTIKRYNRQLTDAQIVQENGGYRLVSMGADSHLRQK